MHFTPSCASCQCRQLHGQKITDAEVKTKLISLSHSMQVEKKMDRKIQTDSNLARVTVLLSSSEYYIYMKPGNVSFSFLDQWQWIDRKIQIDLNLAKTTVLFLKFRIRLYLIWNLKLPFGIFLLSCCSNSQQESTWNVLCGRHTLCGSLVSIAVTWKPLIQSNSIRLPEQFEQSWLSIKSILNYPGRTDFFKIMQFSGNF